MAAEPETSAALLTRARAGDPEAFCQLGRQYENRLLRNACSVCGQAGLAEELARETLVEAWKSLHRYDGRCQFFTWLCAILLHRYRNVLRARHPFPFSALARREHANAIRQLENLPDTRSAPDEAAQQAERALLLRRSLERLPARQREVVYLRFYVDESLESIAAALRCSVGTVKSRLFHGLEKLRAMRELNLATELEKGKS